MTLPNTGKITHAYDSAGRLTSTQLKHSNHSVLDKHDYLPREISEGLEPNHPLGPVGGPGRRVADNDGSHGASPRHERTQQTRADASYVDFTYDHLGQLQSARGYTSGGTPLTTEQKGYKYDAGWNLTVGGAGTFINFASISFFFGMCAFP